MSLACSNASLNNNIIDYESYSMIKNVEKTALDCNVTIFGSYISEIIKHDFYAKKFYEFTKESENCEYYSDKNVNPETYDGRIRKPKSMNCIMNTKQLEIFKRELRNKGIFYDMQRNDNHEDKTKLSWIVVEQCIKSIQYLNISLCNKNIKNEMMIFLKKNVSNNIFKNVIIETPEFKAIIDNAESISNSFPDFEMKIYILKDDVEIANGIRTICSNADFYSQCLIMDNNSVYILKKYQELFLGMKNLSKYISPLDNFQILDNIYSQIMDNTNLSIAISNIKKNKEYINFELVLSSNELCIICQEDIYEGCLSVKLKCCKANYHFNCISQNINKFIKNDKFCIMCNKRYKKMI